MIKKYGKEKVIDFIRNEIKTNNNFEDILKKIVEI